MIAGVFLTPLRRIPVAGGDVLHAMKAGEPGFEGFGEAYFTTVARDAVKGWRRHRQMTLNLVVPTGAIRIVIHDDREGTDGFQMIDLSPDSAETYNRLSVPPGVWTAFRGLGDGTNLMLNLASIQHDPAESDTRPIEAVAWRW